MTSNTNTESKTESLFDRLSTWIRRFVDTDSKSDDIDIEYVKTLEYEHVSTSFDDDIVRCDLCGRLYDATEIQSVFDHLDTHNGQGAAEVDPFESAETVATFGYETITETTDDEVQESDSNSRKTHG